MGGTNKFESTAHAEKLNSHYHHHHALDLYPDLEARPALIRPQSGLWTVTSADEATTAIGDAIRFIHSTRSGYLQSG